MKTLALLSTPTDAHVIVARLDDANIKAYLRDELSSCVAPGLIGAMGGIRVEVADEDWETAREFLELPTTDRAVAVCPFCESFDTKFRTLNPFVAVCFALGLPFPAHRAKVDCMVCKRSFSVPVKSR